MHNRHRELSCTYALSAFMVPRRTTKKMVFIPFYAAAVYSQIEYAKWLRCTPLLYGWLHFESVKHKLDLINEDSLRLDLVYQILIVYAFYNFRRSRRSVEQPCNSFVLFAISKCISFCYHALLLASSPILAIARKIIWNVFFHTHAIHHNSNNQWQSFRECNVTRIRFAAFNSKLELDRNSQKMHI